MKSILDVVLKCILAAALGILALLVILAFVWALPSLAVFKVLVPLGDSISERLQPHART